MTQKYGYFEDQANGDIIVGKGTATDGSNWDWERLVLIQGQGFQHYTRVALDQMPPGLAFDGNALHRALTE